MKRVLIGIAAFASVIAFAGSAQASNVHLKGGKTAEPAFTDNGLTLNARAALSGLGNGDILVTLDATANVISTCTNPAGATQPPGQNPAPINVSGSQAIPDSQIKNGTVSFNVTTNEIDPIIAGAPDCPNSQWTEAINDLLFTSAQITVVQGGSTVFSMACTFNPNTSNGPVPGGTVTCQ